VEKDVVCLQRTRKLKKDTSCTGKLLNSYWEIQKSYPGFALVTEFKYCVLNAAIGIFLLQVYIGRES
jgi:hypothetical protein